jgi:phage-related tail fiber protein
MELTFRHGIIRHQIDTSGTATFLRKSGSNDEFIDLVCDEDTLIFAIAHGVNADYLVTEPRTVTHAWGPMAAHGETQYLYWDISLLNATLSRGFTSVSPYAGPNEPASPQNDQHWYDTNINQMKVWSGAKWIPKLRLFAGTYSNNAIVIPSPRGSQAGLNVACKAGSIILGSSAQPVRDSDGTFITSESNLIASHTSGENLKIEAMQLFGEAVEFIPAFSFVTYEIPGKVKLASSNRPEEIINGIMTNEYFPGQIGNVVANGLVRNEQWNFAPSQVNHPLYIGVNGELSLVEPSLQDKYVVGYVYDKTSIFVDIQWRGGIGQIQAVVGITLAGDVSGAGLSSSAINTTLANSGVTPGTYNNVTVDAKGRTTSGTVEPYLLHNEVITLSGDATGSGSTSIPVTLTNVTTPGTYNSVTVDAKGRVISGSFVPDQNVAPLLVDFVNGASLDVTAWNTKLLNFGSDFLGTNYGLGTITNPGDVVFQLSNTGVAPGNYNRVTVDAKGRVTAATFDVIDLSSTLTGDVTGSGSATIATTLSNTGVTQGTYNNVTVDAKGRVTNGTNEPYLTTVTLTGVITGSGSNLINTSLTPTGVTPGTWNNFTVNAEGRIVGASNVDYDNDTTLTGDVLASGRGIISTALSHTGVVAGTYNSVTVDAKGRVTAATNVPTSTATTLTGDVTGTGTGTITTTLANSGVTPGTYNSVTVDAKGRVTSASNIVDNVGATNLNELSDVTLTSPSNTQVLQYNGSQWVNATLSIPSSIQYLDDLLDVTITTPTANQSLLWNGTEWVNQPLDRIVSQYNNLTSRILVDQTGEIITHNINDTTFITTTPTITAIGKSAPPEFWYALFDAGTVLQSNVVFHATCIDADTNDDIVVGGYAKNVSVGDAIQNKAFVVKYDSLGNIIWQKGFQGVVTQSSPTLTPTTIEALVINQSDTTTYVGLTCDAESSIVKLDVLGNIVWQTKFDTYYGTISDMVVRANDSSLYVSGYQDSDGRGYIGKINMTTGAVDFFYELQRFRTYALELSSSGNELFVGGDLFDSPLDDNFANIFKFNVTGNSFTFVSNVTVNLTGGKRYVELKRSGTSIYALGTQPASWTMGDYSIIKYNEATLAVEASKQF